MVDDDVGIDAPYEAPTAAEIHLKNDGISVAEGVAIVLGYLRKRGLVKQI